MPPDHVTFVSLVLQTQAKKEKKTTWALGGNGENNNMKNWTRYIYIGVLWMDRGVFAEIRI